MRSYGQTPSGSALSSGQLRDLLRQAIDRIEALQTESKAAQSYIDSLEKSETKNEELIKALKERDQVRLDTIAALDAQIAALNQALAVSEKAKADAIKEEERQKKSAHRWKKLATWGTVLGIATGAAAVLLINR